MATASVPVDLFNPGQVFACLGFLEAAEVLLGDAEGGFDWSNATQPHFKLHAKGNENPFGVILEFLSEGQIHCLVPKGYAECDEPSVQTVETFPAPQADNKKLPLRLERNGHQLYLTHWCDESSRKPIKLFAGQQRSSEIANQMLRDVRKLWAESQQELTCDPFGLTLPLGGSSFKFDARKSWTSINAGYSPDDQKHAVEASPFVEILAAVGLEHARPEEYDTRKLRYGVWQGFLPPELARPALGGVHVSVPMRIFTFTLALAGKNKVVTFAEEEIGL